LAVAVFATEKLRHDRSHPAANSQEVTMASVRARHEVALVQASADAHGYGLLSDADMESSANGFVEIQLLEMQLKLANSLHVPEELEMRV
jgi:hypothetical protein